MTSAPVLEPTARRLRADLARIQVDGRLPSVVAGLVRDGGLCWSNGYGDVPGPVDDTQYRIGSITKTITAVAVLRLAEHGELSLDDPVSRWWPASSVGAPYGEVTLRALLGHGGGLPAEPAGDWWERAGRPRDAISLAAAEAGRAAPYASGEVFHYSNLGYALLGTVLERATGTSWWDVVRTGVLDPLGMTRTTYDAVAPSAAGYSVHPHTGGLLGEPTPDTGSLAAAGQLWSTVADLARWLGFLLDGDDAVLPRESLHAAYLPQVGHGAFGPGSRHGLGFQLLAGDLVGHSGSMPGFVASCFADPARGLGAVVLANATTGLAPGPAVTTLMATLAEAEPPLPAPWRPTRAVPDALRPLLGVWYWGARPQVWAMEGEEFVVREDGQLRHRLAVGADGRVLATGGYFLGEEVHLRTTADGVSHLDLGTFVMTREPYAPSDVVPGGRPSV